MRHSSCRFAEPGPIAQQAWMHGPRLCSAPLRAALRPGHEGSEFHGDAGIQRAFYAGVVAHAGRDIADRAAVVVEAELVPPVPIRHPEIDSVRVFSTPHR